MLFILIGFVIHIERVCCTFPREVFSVGGLRGTDQNMDASVRVWVRVKGIQGGKSEVNI